MSTPTLDAFAPTPIDPRAAVAPPPGWGPPVPTPPGSRGSPALGADLLASAVGAAALLAGSTALSAVLVGRSWVLPLVEVVIVVTLLGVGGRLIRVPAVVVVLIQLAGLVIALTSLFTTAGIGGVLPSPAAVGQAHELLTGAWAQIAASVPPAASTPELSFLVATTIGIAALIVDFLIAQAKAPALVALPLLSLFSVPASIALDLLPWYTFAAPVAFYALLLAVVGQAGRQRSLRAAWGILSNGTVIAALAIIGALLVADMFTSVGTEGRLPRPAASAGQIGLSPFTTLKGSLQQAKAVDLITVRGLPGPDYLRTVALTSWTNGKGFTVGNLRSDSESAQGNLTTQPVAGGSTVTVTSTAFRDKFLPILAGTTGITGLKQTWQYDNSLESAHRTDPTDPGTYQLLDDTTKPTTDDLQQDTVTPGGTLTDVGNLPTSVRQLAQQVTAAATSPFAKADVLQKWFTNPANRFTYSLDVPVGNSGDALVDFLDNRQGYCEQYASAMAVMLRSLGIPTRVAIGFTQGIQQGDGTYVINSHDAHAWVEVDFDQHGWVRFDPTPLVNGQGGQQGFGAPPTAVVTTASAGVSSSSAASAPSIAGKKPDSDTTTKAAVGAPSTPSSGPPAWVLNTLWISGAVILLLVLLFGPSTTRWLRRRNRIRLISAAGPHAAGIAWAEIEDLAVDHGVGVSSAESSRVAANRLARRAHLGEADRVRLRQVIVTAEKDWYGPADQSAAVMSDGSVAVLARPTAPAELAAAVRAMHAGLVENAPTTLGEHWWPRSVRRGGRSI